MASLRDLITKFENAKDNLDLAMMDTATSVSLAGKAYAERIILDEGFGAYYSDNKFPAFFLKGKELNKSGLNYLETKEEDDELTNWKEFRNAQGLQTGHVDLHYSNEMFRGMLPQEPRKDGTKYIAALASNNQDGQHKMNFNQERYGNFIEKALGTEGEKQMSDVGLEELNRFLKSYGI